MKKPELWPALIIGFFIILFTADATLIWLAVTTQDDVVQSYRDEER
jgi:hypothetical protein